MSNKILNFKNFQIFEKRVPRDERIYVYEDSNILAVMPLTHRALTKYATNCQWCINNDVDEWEDYHKESHVVIIQKNKVEQKVGKTGKLTREEIFWLSKWDNNESSLNDVQNILEYEFSNSEEALEYYLELVKDTKNFGVNIVYYSPPGTIYDQEDNYLPSFNLSLLDIPNLNLEIKNKIDSYFSELF